MKNMVLEKIKISGRLDDIKNELRFILKDSINRANYPVNAYVDQDNKTSWSIDDVELIQKQIYIMLKFLESECITAYPNFNDIKELSMIIQTKLDMCLHNYSNRLAHRLTPSISMEYIRMLSILGSIFDFFNVCNISEEDFEYTIPIGWNKEEE